MRFFIHDLSLSAVAYDLPLSSTGLSSRVRRRLSRLGLKTLGRVSLLTAEEHRKTCGIGETGVAEVRRVLREHGLFLHGEGLAVLPRGEIVL